jgi:hypothetical protein
MRRALLALVLALVAAGGCGGGDGGDGGGGGGGSAPAEPPEFVDARRAMARDDYDRALAVLKPLQGDARARDLLARYRAEAARETLRNARRKLRSEPQAAVALARVSQRYARTPQATAFMREAERELRRFQARQRRRR